MNGPDGLAGPVSGDEGAGTADDAQLRAFVDEERGRAAAVERARVRRLREQASEEGTLAGTLLDLVEQGASAALRVDGGHLRQGTLLGLGADYCALRLASGQSVYIALEAISTVRPAPGMATGDLGTRTTGEDRTLVEVLSRLAPERPRVGLRLRGDADVVTGELRAVGRDIAEVRLDGPGRPRCYVALAQVWEVVVDPA